MTREQHKGFLSLAVNVAVTTVGLLAGRLLPSHIIIVTATVILIFHLAISPLWPRKWIYAPEINGGNILAGWFAFMPWPLRFTATSVGALTLLLAGCFYVYLVVEEFALPFFYRFIS